jgi:hypothetical protein
MVCCVLFKHLMCCLLFEVHKRPRRAQGELSALQGPQTPEESGMVCYVLFTPIKPPGRAGVVCCVLFKVLKRSNSSKYW